MRFGGGDGAALSVLLRCPSQYHLCLTTVPRCPSICSGFGGRVAFDIPADGSVRDPLLLQQGRPQKVATASGGLMTRGFSSVYEV